MDYTAIDHEASSFVLTARKSGTRFFVSEEGLATDIPGNARRFRYLDHAEGEALEANNDNRWTGFTWSVVTVPGAYNLKAAELQG